ncbi:MAG: deoxycytidylate deaminase [Candidatus Nanoarchaeia archaeon]
MERIGKEKYYLEIAETVAKRSPCVRRKYGAIVVKNDSIVSTGYNGPARGSTNCEIGCAKEILNLPHYSGYDHCPAVHAEENCIINAARNGSSVLEGTLYLYGIDAKTNKFVEGMPCPRCKRSLINGGIEDVITINKNGDIVRLYVKEWAKEDKKNYEKIIQELLTKKK